MHLILLALLLPIYVTNAEDPGVDTIYAKLGENVNLRCKSPRYVDFVNRFCYSTYTFKNKPHSMVIIPSSFKYKIDQDWLTIFNLQPSDAGFYACVRNCSSITAEGIDYYIHPIGKNSNFHFYN